ncbi:hypothetical protein DFH06DRAFT_1322933 [Mycena polygramma]|nr:hypothetical protein DFH06DRAFT_1322933 [Mycena polygramma]
MPHRVGYSGIQIMDLLRRAPNLVECTFDNVHPVNDLDGEILILPSLRRVCFGVPGELPNSDETILLCISLTQLDILLVPLRDTTPEGFFSFLKRSSPPLQELVMDAELLSFEVLSAFFSLIPTLEHLELWRTELQVLDEIFTALADSPSFLPNVHTLKIIRPGSSEDHFNSWKTLSRALSSCRLARPQLRSVRIEPRVTLTCYVFLKLEPAILASFRDLVAGGMELYIGTAADGHNFVFD